MKLKLKILTILTAFFLLAGITGIQAQGIFKSDGFFDDDNPPVTDPDQGPNAPGGDSSETPIGEGILILNLLAGGYALVKRNIRKKNEE